MIIIDMEFDKLIPEIPFAVNISAESEHVSEMKQCIRVIKEYAELAWQLCLSRSY